jgi:hypothetical protein
VKKLTRQNSSKPPLQFTFVAKKKRVLHTLRSSIITCYIIHNWVQIFHWIFTSNNIELLHLAALNKQKDKHNAIFSSNSDAYLFHIFKTTSAIIANKYSKSIYIEQATNFVSLLQNVSIATGACLSLVMGILWHMSTVADRWCHRITHRGYGPQ